VVIMVGIVVIGMVVIVTTMVMSGNKCDDNWELW
jgi:hypothetical protein